MNILKKLFGKDPVRYPTIAQSSTAYQPLIDAARLDPDRVDFTELRLAYAASTEYDPYYVKDNTSQDILDLGRAIIEEKPERILAACERLLARAPFHIWAHGEAVKYYAQAGNHERETYHRKFLKHWWDSILQSGDGRSYATAFVVVSLIEEEVALGMLHVQKVQQRLEGKAGHFFDVWEVRHPATGKKVKIFFNIDLIMKGVQEGRAQLPPDDARYKPRSIIR